MQQTMKKTKFLSTSKLVKISILSAIGYILMFISIPLPMLFPDFLKIDLISGMVIMTIVGCISNYFIILPFYETIGWPIETVVAMGAAINPVIDSKMSFVIWMIAPFNILKSGLISLLTLPMYKKTEKVLNRVK